MMQAGLFGLSDHLKRLSAHGDPLEVLGRVVNFEAFRPVLDAALGYSDGVKGGRPPYDPVTMLKVLVLAAQNNVADARMEYLIRDRLTQARALDALFADFDRQLRERGYLPMDGKIVHATLVAAPKQRNTDLEKATIKDGKAAGEIWPDEPARAAQKDTDARWTLKYAKARATADGRPQPDVAIPSFGYKSSVSICRAFGFIRKGKTTDGARFDGKMLRDVVTKDNTATDVWADTAYRSQSNEKWLKAQGRVSRIHRRKPKGKPMPDHVRRGNATKSKVRARFEHVFAHQKAIMGLFIPTIGLHRAEAKITLANLVYNMHRLIFHERRKTMG